MRSVGVSNYKLNTNFTPNVCATACSVIVRLPKTSSSGWAGDYVVAHTTIERVKFSANQRNIYDVRLAGGQQHVHPDAYRSRWHAVEVDSLQRIICKSNQSDRTYTYIHTKPIAYVYWIQFVLQQRPTSNECNKIVPIFISDEQRCETIIASTATTNFDDAQLVEKGRPTTSSTFYLLLCAISSSILESMIQRVRVVVAPSSI